MIGHVALFGHVDQPSTDQMIVDQIDSGSNLSDFTNVYNKHELFILLSMDYGKNGTPSTIKQM